MSRLIFAVKYQTFKFQIYFISNIAIQSPPFIWIITFPPLIAFHSQMHPLQMLIEHSLGIRIDPYVEIGWVRKQLKTNQKAILAINRNSKQKKIISFSILYVAISMVSQSRPHSQPVGNGLCIPLCLSERVSVCARCVQALKHSPCAAYRKIIYSLSSVHTLNTIAYGRHCCWVVCDVRTLYFNLGSTILFIK